MWHTIHVPRSIYGPSGSLKTQKWGCIKRGVVNHVVKKIYLAPNCIDNLIGNRGLEERVEQEVEVKPFCQREVTSWTVMLGDKNIRRGNRLCLTKAQEQVHGHGWALGGGRAPVATDRETRQGRIGGVLQFCKKIRLKGSEKE